MERNFKRICAAGLLCVVLLSAAACSQGPAEPTPVDVEYDLNLDAQLKDLRYTVSDEWRDMGADKDIKDSHLYTIGKSNTNYIGLAVMYLDEGQVQLDENMEGADIETVRTLDLGDEAYEYKVITESEGVRHETYQIRIGKDGGLYLVTVMGYDVSPADELWEDFVSRLSFAGED